MKNHPYQLIVFDAYGTLLDVYSIGALAERLFANRGSELANLWRDKQIEYTRLISLSDPGKYQSKYYQSFWNLTVHALEYSAKKLALELSVEKKQKLLNEYQKLVCFDDCISALKEIKNKKINTAILSNANQSMLKTAIAANGLDQYLDALISIEQVGQFKTTPMSYALALKHFEVEKTAVLFVSSNAWDIIGSGWFGYDTFWLNRTNLPFEEIGKLPNYQGRSLNDLIAIIKN